MKKLLLLLTFLLLAANLHAAVAFDAASTAFGGLCTNASSCTDNTLTIGSGSNRYLIAFVSTNDTTDNPSSVTWNGVGMTQIIGDGSGGFCSDSFGYCFYIYGLVAPASGAHSLVANFGTSKGTLQVDGVSFTGVAQANSFINTNTSTGTSTSAALTVTTKNGDATVSSALCDNAGHNCQWSANNFTLLQKTLNSGNYMNASYNLATTTSDAYTWTWANSGTWHMLGVDLQAFVASAPSRSLLHVGK